MKRTVAVTGAAGLLGRFVLEELIQHDYAVRALTLEPWSECPVEDQRSGDIREFHWLKENLEGCDAVIHLAAIPNPLSGRDSLVMDTNLTGSYNVFIAAGELGIARVAAASTDCTFGFTFSKHPPKPVYLPVDEDHPDRPDDSYGLSKMLAERVAEGVVQRFPEMYIASLRITHVVSSEELQPGSDFYEGRHDPNVGPNNLWSYIHGEDAARAFRLAVEADRTGAEVFCVASKRTRSAIPTKELIAQFYGDAELRWDFQSHESLENSTKAEQVLGFRAKY